MITVKIFLKYVIAFFLSTQIVSAETPKPLVEVEWLSNNLDKVAILDVRAETKSFTSAPVFKSDEKTKKQYLERVGGHISSARIVLYKNVRGEHKINNKKIKYMLPKKAIFEALIQKAGINKDSSIVITTNAESDFDLTMATRMFWQLKYYGHDDVSILNGGTAQWIIDGHHVETKSSKNASGNWEAIDERKDIYATSEEVAAAIDNKGTQVLDIRPLNQYLGVHKSSKTTAKGHISTAKLYSLDLISNRKMPVKFSTTAELQEVAKALGVQTDISSITYCNSGHMASGGWFVLHELLGNQNVKLYDGSMHQWTVENRPVVKMKME